MTAEANLLVVILTVFCALPFLLGAQSALLVSAEEMGVLSDQGDTTKQIVLAMLYAACGLLIVRRGKLPVTKALGAGLLLLLLWSMASALWADLPALALRRSAALAGTAIMGLYAGLFFDAAEFEAMLCRVVALVVLASLLVALMLPASGLDPEGRLRGVFAHKNSLGVFAGLGFVAVAARIARIWHHKTPWPHLLTAAGCLLCLAAARSVSPLPTTAFASAVLLWARRSQGRHGARIGVVLALACLAGLALPLVAGGIGSVAGWLGRDADFSGRTLVWEFSTDLLARAPWIGFGYGVFWNGTASILFMRWAHFPVAHAHNGFLQLALDLGFVGLALFLGTLGAALRRAARLHDGAEGAAWPLAFMALYLAANMAESLLWEPNELLTVLFVAVVVRLNLAHASVADDDTNDAPSTPQGAES
jgi:O-antigen ligase